MRRVRVQRAAARPAGESDHFGGDVRIQALNPAPCEGESEVLAVFFEPGPGTVPHSHATDQRLCFVDGNGVVGTEGERRLFQSGEMALVPAGEWHWYGATPPSSMCHLSIRPAGPSSWPPDVSFGDWETYMDEVRADG